MATDFTPIIRTLIKQLSDGHCINKNNTKVLEEINFERKRLQLNFLAATTEATNGDGTAPFLHYERDATQEFVNEFSIEIVRNWIAMSSIDLQYKNNEKDLNGRSIWHKAPNMRIPTAVGATHDCISNVSTYSNSYGSNSAIKRVRFCSDFIHSLSDGVKNMIFELIGLLPNLECLQIGYYGGYEPKEKDVSIHWLIMMLRSKSDNYATNQKLNYLRLVDCNLLGSKDECRFFLHDSLMQRCSCLKEFSFRDVQFPLEMDINLFFKVLSNISTLETLEIILKGNNCIGKTNSSCVSAETIESLKNLPRLKRLTLSRVNMDCHCGVALADILKQPNSSLKYLKLSNNNLGDYACVAFAISLQNTNAKLESFDLSGNFGITQVGYDALSDALEHNFFLKQVLISAYNCSYDCLNKIEFYLDLNRSGRYNLLWKDFELGHHNKDGLPTCRHPTHRKEYIDNVVLAHTQYNACKNEIRKTYLFGRIFYWIRARPSALTISENQEDKEQKEPDRKRMRLM